jgi:hypothetical protein
MTLNQPADIDYQINAKPNGKYTVNYEKTVSNMGDGEITKQPS